MAINLGPTDNLDFGTFACGGTTKLGICFTINITGTVTNDARFVQQYPSTKGFLIHTQDTDEISIIISAVSNLFAYKTSGLNLTSGNLYRVAIAWDGDAATLKLWVNGSSVSLSKWYGTDASGLLLSPDSNPLEWGYETGEGGKAGMEGDYSELMICTDTLPPDDILLEYTNGVIPRVWMPASSAERLYLPCWTISHLTDLWQSRVATNNGGATAVHPAVAYGARPVYSTRSHALWVELREGSTVIATHPLDLTTDWATHVWRLTAAQRASISNWSALRVALLSNRDVVDIAQVYLTATTGPSSTSTQAPRTYDYMTHVWG